VNWIYELPMGKGKWLLGNSNGFVDRLVGGWEFHGTARVQSGRPFQFGPVQLIGMTRADLQKCRGVQAKAAELLGLHASTFNGKILRYGIDLASFKGFPKLD
jgi:hypothetical protein